MIQRIWELLPDLALVVRRQHEEVRLTGHHDWIHAFRVAEVAWLIAYDEWGDRNLGHLAGAAGFCHNDDRLLQKTMGAGRRDVPREAIRTLVEAQIAQEERPYMYGSVDEPLFGYLGPGVDVIVDAVLKHDGKNSPEDSKVLIALMDADRIVNLDIDLFSRSGQFYHDLPVVDYKNLLDDPEATYRNPKSVLRDIAYALDWADPKSDVCIRTRLGEKMAAERVWVFRTFFDALKAQLEEEGIRPYPFPS